MLDLPMAINDPLEVQILDEKGLVTCSSRVHDLAGGRIQLNWPTRSGVRVSVRKDQELVLLFTRPDGIYSGKAVVESASPNPTPLIVVRAIGGMERTQRREYYRVRVSLPVKMVGLENRSTGAHVNKASGLHIIARTIDISGGGLAIHKEFPIMPGTEFDIALTLEEDQPPLELTGRVVYSEPIRTFQGRQLYRVAMAFVDIQEAARRRIIRHIFKLQQMMTVRVSEGLSATES